MASASASASPAPWRSIPQLVVLDEPVSALDVSVQAQILNLLQDLQHQFGLTYLFVAHDLSVVEHISDRVAVMYVGQLVESADTKELFTEPLAPLYRGAAVGRAHNPIPAASRRLCCRGMWPTPPTRPRGCYFHPRCSYNDGKRCTSETPQLREVAAGPSCAAAIMPMTLATALASGNLRPCHESHVVAAPPNWTPTMPHSGAADLTAYLRGHGVAVIQRDLNLEVFDAILTRQYIAKYSRLREHLWGGTQRDPGAGRPPPRVSLGVAAGAAAGEPGRASQADHPQRRFL